MDQADHGFTCHLASDSNVDQAEKGWFYFKVSNVKTGDNFRFQILGLSMNSTLFNKGMRPMFQDQETILTETKWRPVHFSKIIPDDTKTSSSSSYSLVFQHQFRGLKGFNWSKFALFEPYSYSNML